ncbi:MAG: hypothetical protein MZW92_38535 [Comamonadaceae bacterium]|nr:hypothetical protein [Comamonadaceae bacterium]
MATGGAGRPVDCPTRCTRQIVALARGRYAGAQRPPPHREAHHGRGASP